MQSLTELRPVVKTEAVKTEERRLGWLVYAEGMPADVCGSPEMVSGWHQANRDEVAAMCEVSASSTQVKPRIVAIGRCENGGAFKVFAPPADWPSDDEIDAILARPARLTDEQVEEMELERIGAELCEAPWNW